MLPQADVTLPGSVDLDCLRPENLAELARGPCGQDRLYECLAVQEVTEPGFPEKLQ
jgi:hypothetical protein